MRTSSLLFVLFLLTGCAGGLGGGPGSVGGDASSPELAWDTSLMMGVQIYTGTQETGGSIIYQLQAIECEDIIASPLTVGDVPEGTEEIQPVALPLEPGNYFAGFSRCVDQGYGDGPQLTPVGDVDFSVLDDGTIEMGSLPTE